MKYIHLKMTYNPGAECLPSSVPSKTKNKQTKTTTTTTKKNRDLKQ